MRAETLRAPVLAAHQPNLLPWLGLVDKVDAADVFVWLDDVQLVRRTWLTRVDISVAGRRQTLRVPVRHEGDQQRSIREARLDRRSREWGKHRRTLRLAYGRAPGWPAVGPAVLDAFGAPPETLLELNRGLLEALLGALGVTTAQRWQSQLQPPVPGARSERLAGLAQRLGARTYLSGGHRPPSHPPPTPTGTAADYNDPAVFERAGVHLAYQGFTPFGYATPHGPAPAGLSSLDALCWLGPEQTLALLRAQRT